MKKRTIRVVSCGAKHGKPPEDADLLIDCRGFENPHYDPKLCPQTGAARAVRHFLENSPGVPEMREALTLMLKAWLPGLLTNSRYHLEKDILLVFKCTGGKHRSRYFTIEARRIVQELISSHPEWEGVRVVINHRDKTSLEN